VSGFLEKLPTLPVLEAGRLWTEKARHLIAIPRATRAFHWKTSPVSGHWSPVTGRRLVESRDAR